MTAVHASKSPTLVFCNLTFASSVSTQELLLMKQKEVVHVCVLIAFFGEQQLERYGE